jgi:hypothetical protein
MREMRDPRNSDIADVRSHVQHVVSLWEKNARNTNTVQDAPDAKIGRREMGERREEFDRERGREVR